MLHLVAVEVDLFLEDIRDRDIQRNIILEALHFQAEHKSVIFLQEVLLVVAVGDELLSHGEIFARLLLFPKVFSLRLFIEQMVDDIEL